MNKLFFFKGVSAQHVKVSHGGFVGLPSLTGLTGLNRNFAIQLALELDLPPEAIQPAGALLAIEGYHLHEGYKKGHKPKTATYEAIPAAWASFTAHIALEVCAVTEEAKEKLAGAGLEQLAQELLANMQLCKGSLRDVKKPIDLAKWAKTHEGSARQHVLQLLPSQSLIIRDYSYVIASMRQEGLPLMDALVAAALPHSKRPRKYQAFYESEAVLAHEHLLAPVMAGLMKLESSPSLKSIRPDASGRMDGSTASSPAFTLARLQQAASLRIAASAGDEMWAFWREHKYPQGYFCAAEA